MSEETPRILARPENALLISGSRCPMLVLTDRRGFGPWAIEGLTGKGRESGHYNHAAALLRRGVIVEQAWRFQAVGLNTYLDRKHRVKFWFNPRWTNAQREAVTDELWRLLVARGKYDWGGVVMHGLAAVLHAPGLKKIGIRGRYYCSEAMVTAFRRADMRLFADPHASPADLDRACKAHPEMRAMVYDPTL